MRVVDLPQILGAIDEDDVLNAVELGFRRLSAGQADLMAVGHLVFPESDGDCHVKGGYLHGDDVFVLKLGTSFYRNAEIGLPSSNGFMAVVNARTGALLAILHDQGRLTDLRTAMAGAIAARAIARPGSKVLGVVGSGMQAEMQARQIARVLKLDNVLVWARNSDKAAALASELGGEAVALPDLCARADLIVTTTPSTEPLLTAAMVPANARIVAVGADAPGKRELDVDLVARARILVDSRAQCIDHGEAGWAVRAGLVDPSTLMELGQALSDKVSFRGEGTVIADLTGVAVQDVQIAKAVWARISAQT